MDPPLDVQQQVNMSGDLIQDLRDELRQAELEAQKKRLVDTFYNKVNRAYGLHPEGRIDYSQFGIDDATKHSTGHLTTKRSLSLRRGEDSGF